VQDSRRQGPWLSLAGSVLLVVAATGLGFLARGHVAPVNVVMVYLLAVVVCGRWWGLGSAVLASLLGVVTFDLVFVPPYLSFQVSDAQYLFTFGVFLVVALVISTLTGRLLSQSAALRVREQETLALYSFSRSMAAARDLVEIAEAAVSHTQASLGRPVAILLLKDASAAHRTLHRGVDLTPAEREAASWSLENGKPCGWGTSDCEGAGVGCVPLRTAHGVHGVLAARHPEGGRFLTLAQRRLLKAFAAQAAVVVERTRLAEEARQAQLLKEAEQLQDALLHSVSHALRTPLASIIGSLSALLDPDQLNLDEATRHDLAETARDAAEHLDYLVRDLLDMTRLESGHLQLLVDWYDIEDVLGAALGQSERILADRSVRVQVEEGLPLVPLDQVLVVEVLENLLSNAVKYSPPGTPIDIRARMSGAAMEIEVADRGIGIPPQDLERVFGKFYRVEGPGGPAGTGLGLAICKGIVEAHHGRIWAAAREGGGTVVTLALPLQSGTVGTEAAATDG